MAFNTLGGLRQNRLNVELGLSTDVDTGNDSRFGTRAERNLAIADAIRNLWPMCARMTRETVPIVEGQVDYTLATVWDVMAIETTDSLQDVAGATGVIAKYRSWRDETADPPVVRLMLLAPLRDTLSMRVIGYAPYTVPSVDGDTLDIPPLMEPVITAGARAILYLRRINQFVDFERFQNTDRATMLSPEQMLTMWQAAQRQYDEGMRRWPRGATEPKIATFR